MFNLWEEVAEFDISCQKKTPGTNTTEMELGMQKLELDLRTGALISRNQVSKLSKNVASNFDHVLVASWTLKGLKDSLGSITLNILAVDNNLKLAIEIYF